VIAAEPVRAVVPPTPDKAATDIRLVTIGVQASARGLAIRLNLNPDRHCNFRCVYCPVDRRGPMPAVRFDVDQMAVELRALLAEARADALRWRPELRDLPPELLHLRHVMFDGDGEPTLAPEFTEAVEAVIHLRAQRAGPFFKLVLRTNGSRLDTRPVQSALEYFTREDEVWIKLDAGTQEWMDRVNRPDCTLERVLTNIAQVSRRRTVVIESVFSALGGQAPPMAEVVAYLERLRELRAAGSQIALVRLQSADGTCGDSACRQIPLRQLSEIAHQIRTHTGLRSEVH
jgi:wyosine [tRNA(Phe)-imidazoG37] synthetase (radical SAM superfamily)